MRGDLLAVRREQRRQPVGAVDDGGALPRQVVQPDVVERDGLWRHIEQAGERALIADRHVAQADGAVPGVQQGPGDDADRVGEVDDPGVGRRARPHPLGDVQHDRHRPQRLGESAGPGRLLADAAALQRPGLVAVPGGLTADSKLQKHGARPVDGGVEVGRPGDDRRVPVAGHDPGGERADDRQPLGVRVDQHQFGDLDVAGQPGDAVDQLRGVGRAAAYNREFHENAFG